MKLQNKFLALIAGTALALSGSAFAGPQSVPPTAAVKQAVPTPARMTRGIVKAMDANKLVIEHKTKSGEKEMTIVMNSDTQKQGDMKIGSPVIVHYRNSNKQHLATTVQVRTAKKAR